MQVAPESVICLICKLHGASIAFLPHQESYPKQALIGKCTSTKSTLRIGREYYVGRHLTVRPNGGLRADWIYQNYDVTYTAFTFYNPQHFKMDNRFFGFGFFGGVDSDWLFGRGFSLYGMADFAILLGFFAVDQKVTQLDPLLGATKGTLTAVFAAVEGSWT